MPHQIQITVSPKESAIQELLQQKIASETGCRESDIARVQILRRSIDARKRGYVKILITAEVYMQGEALPVQSLDFHFDNVSAGQPVLIVGAGPAGLFAAFRLIEKGLKPIIIERGKEVSGRKRDIAQLCRGKGVNPESNYCFGEGGAGTFSDGKLYTRSNKRGDVGYVLRLFHYHGANDNVLIDNHPHIGTDVLPSVIRKMRQTITQCGGEFHFGQKLTGLIVKDSCVQGISTASGEKFYGKATLLATGHSASDIYELFSRENYLLEAKAFAMGIRIEHPQALMNDILYHRTSESEYLPAAAYSLTSQVDGRGVYSFCMCPGGFIVPASTVADGQVVNGMSPSGRNSAFANSGIVTEIRLDDLSAYQQHGVLAGLRFQQEVERLAATYGGGQQIAPAQRTLDFVKGNASSNLPACSYLPGIVASPLHEWLPHAISRRLQEAFRIFERKMTGFLTSESLVAGVESRSSSPVRIPRDMTTWQHPQLKNLYPCGEGSGYAGGITSSALDGIKAADMIATDLGGCVL
ncbi:MAG: FAD-binding protein [Bacteroidales bacterium]|nr:FAD-binding protein [Bacteroidales bacterium]